MKEEVKNNEEKDLKASEAVESEASASADDEGPTLKEVIAKQATEDESPFASHFTLKKILGGDVLTEKSRESHVLELLKNNKDSVLKIASQPPYIINVPEE